MIAVRVLPVLVAVPAMDLVQARPAATILPERLELPAAVQCIRRARLQPDLRVRDQLLVRRDRAWVVVQALAVHVPVWVVLRVPVVCCRQGKHRVRSVRVVRHAVVGGSSIRRPKKAR